MPQQPSFAGFDDAPATDRLFFAIFPDIAAAANVTRLTRHLCDEYRLSGRPLATERLHVTIYHLGDHPGLPKKTVGEAIEAAANVVMPPFEVTFDYAMSFGRQKNAPFVLRGGDGVAKIVELQRVLGVEMEKAGLRHWTKSRPEPHVTLLYDRQPVDPQRVEPVSWKVREFVLVHSLLGKTQHIPLGRWPLRD
jgi:RNA 2',3'-cyclic 3'-phosphodiesterase